MIESFKRILNLTLVLAILVFVTCCTPAVQIVSELETNPHAQKYGTIELDFPINDFSVPQKCIKRADLSIGFTADSLFRKEYVSVANVSSYQHLYDFVLEPGEYYYQAAKVCVCGGDTCLSGGYPGGQNGMLWTIASFKILSEKTSYDKINFN